MNAPEPSSASRTASPEPGEVSIVLSTAPNPEVAATLARSLVEDALAACVNIVPAVRSIYTWKGQVSDEAEVLLVIKTRSALVPALQEAIRARHPYETPEVLAFPAADGLPSYLSWVIGTTKAP